MHTARLNYVRQYGVIMAKFNYFLFKAFPDVDCPILEIRDTSKWRLIDTAYELIKELK